MFGVQKNYPATALEAKSQNPCVSIAVLGEGGDVCVSLGLRCLLAMQNSSLSEAVSLLSLSLSHLDFLESLLCSHKLSLFLI